MSQKAISLIETLSDQAIKAIMTCFELQFDCVINDRPMLLRIITKFYSCFAAAPRTQTILSWDFFLHRLNSLSLESQLVNDILSPVDISGVNANNNNFQRKINMARLALKRSDFIRGITHDLSAIFTNNTNIFGFNLAKPKPKRDLKQERSQSVEIGMFIVFKVIFF